MADVGLLPVNGIGAVNARGEVALFVEPLPPGMAPTAVRQLGNRLTIMSGDAVASVRAYAPLTTAAARRRGRVFVFEVEERPAAGGDGGTGEDAAVPVRATEVPVEIG